MRQYAAIIYSRDVDWTQPEFAQETKCADLDEAVTVAATIPGAWDGAVEVRPVIDFGG
jgi:hypothetical protein